MGRMKQLIGVLLVSLPRGGDVCGLIVSHDSCCNVLSFILYICCINAQIRTFTIHHVRYG
jgi:hypothetical protein